MRQLGTLKTHQSSPKDSIEKVIPTHSIFADYNAPVFQHKQIFIRADAAKIWAVLIDLNRWNQWNSRIGNMKIQGPLNRETSFTWSSNGATIRSTIHTLNEFQLLGWTGKTFGGEAIHNWSLVPEKDGTLVVVKESMNGWLVRLFKKRMGQMLADDMVFWLKALKFACEGEASKSLGSF